jgi:ribosomal protein L19
MKFAEVAVLLREIVDRCPSLEGATITLMPQKAMYPLFEGYHINIKANLTKESMSCLRKIVEGHDLVMKIKTDSIVIYETRS